MLSGSTVARVSPNLPAGWDSAEASVFIYEDEGRVPFESGRQTNADRYYASGRFSAGASMTAPGQEGARFPDTVSVEGPRWATLDEAVEWGRAHADFVVVTVTGEDFEPTRYYAGTKPFREEWAEAPDDLQRWPVDGLSVETRVVPGHEWVVRTAGDEEISWDVRVSGWLMLGPGDDVGRRMVDALDADAAVEVLHVEVGPEEVPPPGVDAWTSLRPTGSGDVEAYVRVSASTMDEAVEQVTAALVRAAADSGAAPRHDTPAWSLWDHEVAPTGNRFTPRPRRRRG